MKTFKLLFMLTFFVSVAFAQETDNSYDKTLKSLEKATSTVYSDLKSKSPKVERALESLGKEFKVGVESVWEILVKQQKIYSTGILILTLMTILSWIHFYYRINLFLKAPHNDSDKYIAISIFSALISIIGTLIASHNFINMLTGFFNPEFGAMKTIIDVAESLK